MYKITPPCKVWQWDINDTVTVEGIESISEWQVHFATVGDTTALVIEIRQDMTAYIPNQLVELGTAIYAYLYNVREERAYTETAVLIPVNTRPKPSDYISEPTDVLTWGQLRADIGTLSELLTEDKTNLVAAVNELHGDVETAYSEIDSIETTTTEQGQSITAIQSKIKKIERSITDINSTDTAQSQQIEQNQQDIGELEQSDTQLTKSVSSLAQTVDKGFERIQTELDKKQPAGDYITNAVDNLANYYLKSETYSRSEVKELIGSLTHINIKVVSSIDDVTEPNVIYLVPVNSGKTDDYYNEYILVNGNPELIGNTRVDLSDYYTRKQTDDLLNKKQPVGNYVRSVNGNAPDEGGNVSIDVQTYTAGEGIDISDSGAIAVTNPMDDEQVSAGTMWSSSKSIQTLAPTFILSGNAIICTPIEDTTLAVEGSGKLVWAGGKNLLDYSAYGSYSTSGVDIVYNPDDQTFTLNGTATETIARTVYNYFVYAKGKTLIISANRISGSVSVPSSEFAVVYVGYGDDLTSHSNYINTSLDGTINYINKGVCKSNYVNAFWFFITPGVTFDNLKVQIQLELGDEATPFEPYIGEPLDIQLPTTVTAKSGRNLLFADTGDVTVTGYEDPRHTIAQLTSRIAALESAASGI